MKNVIENSPTSTLAGGNPPKGPKLKKLVVAVHGIGKQFRYATIQSVADRFGAYCDLRFGIPLGNFHPSPSGSVGALRVPDPPYPPKFPEGLIDTGFAEIFWANIPGEAVKQADTIEETKAWAKTVVERVRALDCEKNSCPTINYEKTSAVVDEMIETIGVIENLLFLGRKAGVVKFDLQELLTDYLGDIQIVTEFADYRARILKEFHHVMRELARRHEPEEIYVVAHSEGTVVAFYGLLEAMSVTAPQGSEWVDKVAGFMTIGSPIDKHLVMWPRMWDQFERGKSTGRTRPIQWRNYFDFGDPVGFELDTARQWLLDGNWMHEPPDEKNDCFHFTRKHEYGFTRYPFPGKAHNDYWEDKAVFDHFIADVIRPEKEPRPAKRPPTLVWPWLISWIAPYILCFVILLAGAYIIYKPVSKFIHGDEDLSILICNVVAIASLLAGMTVLARVPRMVKSILGLVVAALVFGLSVFIYNRLIDIEAKRYLSLFFTEHFEWAGDSMIVWVLGTVGVVGGLASYFFPRRGLKPVVALLGLVTCLVLTGILLGPGSDRPLWPIFLSGAAFLYLWWLAALIFDLVFVWHRYIRFSSAVEKLRSFKQPSKKSRGKEGKEPVSTMDRS
jgi:hypothetical protein